MTSLAASPTLGVSHPLKLQVSRLKMVPLFSWGTKLLENLKPLGLCNGKISLDFPEIFGWWKNVTPQLLNLTPAGFGFPVHWWAPPDTPRNHGIWLGDLGMFYWPTSMNLEVEWEKRLLKTHFLVNDVKIEWQVAWNKIEKSYNSGISFLGKPCWGSEPTWKFGMHVQARKPQFKLKIKPLRLQSESFSQHLSGKKKSQPVPFFCKVVQTPRHCNQRDQH